MNWLKRLLGMTVPYTVSFDSIIAPIQKVVSDLETHITENQKLGDQKSMEASKLTAQAAAHAAEATKASVTADKFKALIVA